MRAGGAGENFFPWIKSRKSVACRRCPKKITWHKQAVKSGDNHFGGGGLGGWHRRC